MIGELEGNQTRGLLWVRGKVDNGVLHVDAPGGRASLEILRTESKVKPVLKENGGISIRIDIMEEGVVASAETKENLSTIENAKIVEENTIRMIEEEIRSAIEKSRELNADIFGFGDLIHRKYPKAWEHVWERWDEVYAQLEIEIHVKSRLRGLGALRRQIVPGGAS